MSTNQQRIVFGYNRNSSNKIELHKMQAQVVRHIFMCCADGSNLRQIKATLEGGSILSPQNKPTWSQQTIANILTYNQYAGDDTYPAIVERELLERVRARQSAKKLT